MEIGRSHTSTLIVEDKHLASNVGSGDLNVLATPIMVSLMENAAMCCVRPLLEDGTTTVGGHIDVSHLKPTALGKQVKATATLTIVEERKMTFHVVAEDEEGIIGEGTHLRFVVNAEKFMNKIK